ncbi:MAG: hypothetical protein K2W95_24935 [Candidatus Obscuribacterales bacterium]|nr:hypothetical protein [Candidatus Obscuribacterales bacterium]
MPENEIGVPRKAEPAQSPPNWGQEAIERATKSYALAFAGNVGVARQIARPNQLVVEHESKLKALGKFLLDNFELIDSDNDKTLSRIELEKASVNPAIDARDRAMLKLAEKNIELLSGLCEESTNYDRRKDPAFPDREIKGQISRYDLYTLQKALIEPVATDPYESKMDRWTKNGAIFGGMTFGSACGALSAYGGSKLAARYISQAGGTRGQLLMLGSSLIGVAFGTGASALAGRELFKFNHGSSSEYYLNRVEQLTKINW